MTKKSIAVTAGIFVVILAVLIALIPVQRKNELYAKWGTLAELAETDERISFIIENEDLYPEELIDMLHSDSEHYVDFVYNYPFHKDDYANMEYTAEELDGRVPALYMSDSRWCYQTLDGDFFIKTDGCALVSLTMAYIGLTGKSDLDPYKIMLIADEMGAIGTFGGITDEDTAALCEAVGLKVSVTSFSENMEKVAHADLDTIKSDLDSGHIIMAGMAGETFGVHAIIIHGCDGDNLIINDPADPEKTARLWSFDAIEPEMMYLYDLSV